jgi:hypothetical protein
MMMAMMAMMAMMMRRLVLQMCDSALVLEVGAV